MDNKRLISAMLLGLVLMIGWYSLITYLNNKHPEWDLLGQDNKKTSALETPATRPATARQVEGVALSPTTSATPDPAALGFAIRPAPAPQVVVLGSVVADDPNYPVAVRLTSRGAGVESVTLNHYKRQVDSPDRYVYQTPSAIRELEDASRVLASRAVTINGQTLQLDAIPWALVSSGPSEATFSADVVYGDAQYLTLTKAYRLAPVTKEDHSKGYEVKVDLIYTNRSQQPVTVASQLNGTAAPPWELERGGERLVVHSYLAEAHQQVHYRHTAAESFTADKRVVDITRDVGKPEPLGWFGTSGAYFNALVRPEPIAGSTSLAPNYLAKVEARLLNPDEKQANLHEIVTTFETVPLQLAPGQSVTLPLRVYFGPKQRTLLDAPYYSKFPLNYDQTLITTAWLCSFCTFQWLIGILVWMLNAFHMLTRDWGVAIILLVCVVRLLLHPVTRKSQENMVKMGKMAPELDRIKKKHGDDKEALNRAMMQFYKEQGATPILGCLPMLLQTPIWIALYAGLQSTFELRHQPFLYGMTWIHDLARPDQLVTFAPFSLFGLTTISGLHIIPFLLAVVFFLQYKMTPKPPVQTPEQQQQQKMMQWMTLLFPVFLYNAPAGLNIYILTSTTFGIIESKMIRDRIKRDEEAAKQGKVTVIDAPSRAGNRAKGPASRKGLTGWIHQMQERAEEIRNQQQKKKKR